MSSTANQRARAAVARSDSHSVRRRRTGWFMFLALMAWLPGMACVAQEPLTGNLYAHDPSTVLRHADRYYTFMTGYNIASKSSSDRLNWSAGPSVFTDVTRPDWTTNIPNFTGTFWAPDVIFLNGQYYLYYSVSSFGSQNSGIGLATNPTLDPADPEYLWTDQGPVIQSDGSVNYNAIDPSVMLASDGRLWMAFGSFWTGIKMIELDPATGKRISPASQVYAVATHPPSTAIEAACLLQRSNYFYLFVNWDTCCAGLNSTYQIRVGRGTSPYGPFYDQNGATLLSGGGTLLLEGTGRYVGPGHTGVLIEGETNWMTFHYYDARNNGVALLGMTRLHWDEDDWPHATNDWCAYYPFETDAREHLGQFNGQLLGGASIVDEPGRSRVLQLNSAGNEYVKMPVGIANARTFAAWVKWNGGDSWQRIFDLGNGTGRYLFLSPLNGATSRLRFAITTNGNANEQVIDAPFALPTNSWCHLAVTLDGSVGRLYFNGLPVAVSNNMSIRPWQVLARTNYLGDSQWPADPFFDGRIDSVRVYGRALGEAEVMRLAQAHPALAHRYSFNGDAADSMGAAHGQVFGSALVTNNALQLDGTSGNYAALPGGLVTNCPAVTIEFWATFGTNATGARVFDFGRTSGSSGLQYLGFNPGTDTGTHRLALSTTSSVAVDGAGRLDGRAVHVVCIVDAVLGYSAIYTNGILEAEVIGTTPALSTVSGALSYVGRSLFTSDPWLNASIDEFRIYHGRLTPKEIAADALAGPDALALPITLERVGSPPALTLRWPSYAAGFNLESSASLGPDAVWSAVAGAPVITGGVFQWPLSATDAQAFLRLRR